MWAKLFGDATPREALLRCWCIATHRRWWVWCPMPPGWRGWQHYECRRCNEYYFGGR